MEELQQAAPELVTPNWWTHTLAQQAGDEQGSSIKHVEALPGSISQANSLVVPLQLRCEGGCSAILPFVSSTPHEVGLQ